MNFKEICQRVEIESGTVDVSALLSTVVGQTSRKLKVVGWVQAAWQIVQGARTDWRFMRREYGQILQAGKGSYTGADLSVPRFSMWLRDQRDYRPHSIYDPDIGATDLTPLSEISWNRWRDEFGRGAQTAGRPQVYAISPDDRICLGPVPDKAYRLEGEYLREFQSLAADSDVPEIPATHHLVIVWRALMLLADHDEADKALSSATAKFITAMEKLERDQVDRPRIGRGPPIA